MILNLSINYYVIKEVIYVKISTRKQTESEIQECGSANIANLAQKLDCFQSKLQHT